MEPDIDTFYTFADCLCARSQSNGGYSKKRHATIPLDGGEIRVEYGNGNLQKGAQQSRRLTVRIFPDNLSHISGDDHESFHAEWGYAKSDGSIQPYVLGNMTPNVRARIYDMITQKKYLPGPVTQE